MIFPHFISIKNLLSKFSLERKSTHTIEVIPHIRRQFSGLNVYLVRPTNGNYAIQWWPTFICPHHDAKKKTFVMLAHSVRSLRNGISSVCILIRRERVKNVTEFLSTCCLTVISQMHTFISGIFGGDSPNSEKRRKKNCVELIMALR